MSAPGEHSEKDTRILLATPMPEEDPFPADAAGSIVEGRWRYRVCAQLGQGAFGSVYRAVCISGQEADVPREVAVKLFSGAKGISSRSLLKRELSALQVVEHPRIPAVYDWSFHRDPHFVAIQYYANGSLATLLERSGALSEQDGWNLLEDLLSGVAAAHKLSILHLDIKPSNVLLCDDGRFALGDFGLSRGKLVPDTMVEVGLGTPGYQAPEQFYLDTRSIGTRTDLWGVGVTVWSALTGQSPHKNKALLDLRDSSIGDVLPPIRQIRPEISEGMERLLCCLLARHPKNRPGGAPEALLAVKMGARSTNTDFKARPQLLNAMELKELLHDLIDPLWLAVCSSAVFRFEHFPKGAYLGIEGERSYCAFVLLKGEVSIIRGDELIRKEIREGTFLGEASTLTGTARTASMFAETDVIAIHLNAGDFEELIARFPAAGMRLIHDLALRLTQ